MAVVFARLVDHPEAIPALVSAYEQEWPQWYGAHGNARADFEERARRTGLPIGFVALEDAHAVGTLAIAERATPSHAHLKPWIIGFWVEPARRNRGIGAELLKTACEHACEAGMEQLYASTATVATLFLRAGWTKIDVGKTAGGDAVDIFHIALT